MQIFWLFIDLSFLKHYFIKLKKQSFNLNFLIANYMVSNQMYFFDY